MFPDFMPRQPLAVSEQAYTAGPIGGAGKRIFDLAFASISLVFLAPVMVLIGASLKMLEGGPVLYAHKRVGYRGVEFDCLKFRTMAVNSTELLRDLLAQDSKVAREWAETHKLKQDPRISRIGRLLRRTSLDELPQLFNIIRGEMSLVGPRPVTIGELARYGASADLYRRARPGLTGLWQVSRTDETTYDMRVRLDVEYVVNQTHKKDIAIIARTVRVVLTGQGAC